MKETRNNYGNNIRVALTTTPPTTIINNDSNDIVNISEAAVSMMDDND